MPVNTVRTTNSPAGIDIRIDVLSLPAGLAAGSATIAAAFQHELTRLVGGDGDVRKPPRPAASLACDYEFSPGTSDHEVGVRIARAVFEGLQR